MFPERGGEGGGGGGGGGKFKIKIPDGGFFTQGDMRECNMSNFPNMTHSTKRNLATRLNGTEIWEYHVTYMKSPFSEILGNFSIPLQSTRKPLEIS